MHDQWQSPPRLLGRDLRINRPPIDRRLARIAITRSIRDLAYFAFLIIARTSPNHRALSLLLSVYSSSRENRTTGIILVRRHGSRAIYFRVSTRSGIAAIGIFLPPGGGEGGGGVTPVGRPIEINGAAVDRDVNTEGALARWPAAWRPALLVEFKYGADNDYETREGQTRENGHGITRRATHTHARYQHACSQYGDAVDALAEKIT